MRTRKLIVAAAFLIFPAVPVVAETAQEMVISRIASQNTRGAPGEKVEVKYGRGHKTASKEMSPEVIREEIRTRLHGG